MMFGVAANGDGAPAFDLWRRSAARGGANPGDGRTAGLSFSGGRLSATYAKSANGRMSCVAGICRSGYGPRLEALFGA